MINDKSLLILLSILAGLTIICAPVDAKIGPTHGKVVVCYISTWAVYRPGRGAYSIENFDSNLCTHAVYAFAGLDIAQAAIKSLDPWQDLKEEYGKGGYERLTALKRSHPHLKVNLAIGGWNEGSKNYSLLVANPEQRQRFVKQVTGFIRKYNFDGLDLDWEYPTQRGGAPQDRENFVLLTKELREEFDRHNLMLTSAIGAAKHVIDQAYNVRQISRYLDFLHIMCYDYHGSWDKVIGFNAPLKSSDGDPLSVQYTIDYLLKLGAPKEKLVVGLPFYGRTFITPFDGLIGDRAEGKALQGPYTREEGFLGYNEICNLLSNKSSGWTTTWHSESAQMVARSPRDPFSGTINVVTFDNTRAIANKVRFIVDKNLAGVMVWSIDTDDFNGDCELESESETFADYESARSQQQLQQHQQINANYPLLRTINKALILAQEELKHKHDKNKVHDDDGDFDVSENEIPQNIDAHNHKENNAATTATTTCAQIISIYCLIFSFRFELHF